MISNKDKFGYYTVGDFKTYSKLEAIELHQKINVHPNWHFNDAVFSNFDWTIEPTSSLKDLYAMRARQLREQYDYIVLCYSSGSDSQNILKTFIENNIHLDEIASFWSLEGDKTYDSNFNQEIYECAIPTALSIIDQHRSIKHRVIDFSEIIAKIFADPNIKFDFIYQCNAMFPPNSHARGYLREYVDDYKNIIDSGKRLCFLYGGDKPRIFLEHGKYCLRFIDLIDGCVSPRTQILNRPWEHDELFYWSPDLPQLIAKQAHTVIKYLRGDSIDPNDFEQNGYRKSFGSIEKNGTRYYLHDQGLHKLIYGFHTHTIKPLTFAYTDRDRWFWSRPTHLHSAQNWINGIDKLETMLPSYWLNDGVFYNGIKACLSQPYLLEK